MPERHLWIDFGVIQSCPWTICRIGESANRNRRLQTLSRIWKLQSGSNSLEWWEMREALHEISQSVKGKEGHVSLLWWWHDGTIFSRRWQVGDYVRYKSQAVCFSQWWVCGMVYIVVCQRAGSPTNRPGGYKTRDQRSFGPSTGGLVKNESHTWFALFLLRQGEPGTSQYIWLEVMSNINEVTQLKQRKPVQIKCKLCLSTFSSKRNLRQHMEKHNDMKYNCTLCDYETCQERYLTAHFNRKHSESHFKCAICYKEYSQKSALKNHMMMHNNDKPFKCNLCDYASHLKQHLRKHSVVHMKEKPFACQKCTARFSAAQTLQNHLKNIHLEGASRRKVYSCSKCDYSGDSSSALCNHRAIHGDTRVNCLRCGQTYTSKLTLRAHMKRHDERNKDFRCSECDKAFFSKNELERHAIVHSGIKAHKCPLCAKYFTLEMNMKRHLKIRHLNRKVKCSICLASYPDKESLKVHFKQIHLKGDQNHKCAICELTCTTKGAIKQHVKVKHTKDGIMCTFCDRRFSCEHSLKQHMKRKCGQKDHVCGYCRKGFVTITELRTHVKKYCLSLALAIVE